MTTVLVVFTCLLLQDRQAIGTIDLEQLHLPVFEGVHSASGQMAGPLVESGSKALNDLCPVPPGCPESKDSFLLVSGFIVA